MESPGAQKEVPIISIKIFGGNVMKQLCYLFWLAGMATLVAYGWSDTLLNQVSDVVHFMGQLVASVIA